MAGYNIIIIQRIYLGTLYYLFFRNLKTTEASSEPMLAAKVAAVRGRGRGRATSFSSVRTLPKRSAKPSGKGSLNETALAKKQQQQQQQKQQQQQQKK